MEIVEEEIFRQAELARTKAYAPYSGFGVGAVLLAKNGDRFEGSNVENRSFGLTICAERVALGTAISSGQNRFQLLAIVSDSAVPVVPCGACRQMLAEFSPGLRIISRNLRGQTMEFDLATLLPLPAQGILG